MPLRTLEEALKRKIIFAKPVDSRLTLTEKDASASLRQFELTNLPADTLVIKPDSVHIDAFDGGRYSKRCDYIVFTRLASGAYAFFIELKSSSASGKKYISQLNGASCLFDYFDSVLKHFHHGLSLTEYKKRFVFVYKLPLDKEPTNVKKLPRLLTQPSAPNTLPANACLVKDQLGLPVERLIFGLPPAGA